MSRIDMNPQPLVILDNGHGNNSAGKRSPVWPDGTQLLEWQWTRHIAREVQARLALMGYDARLLVPEERDIPIPVRISRAREWVNEHRHRGGIAAMRILVSIHANASTALLPSETPLPGKRASGWEAFMHGADTNSCELGQSLYRHAMELLPEQFPIRTRRGDARTGAPLLPKKAEFSLLAFAPCVAVLTENLFMDNAADCHYLLSPEGQQTIIRLHVQAIDEYMSKRL